MSLTITDSREDVSVVEHHELGVLGLVHRSKTSQGYRYRGVTPAGAEGPLLRLKSDAGLWLQFQVRAPQAEKAPDDVVLAMLKRHVAQGRQDKAEAAALVAIAQEIEAMRQARARKRPPALWWHLDRMTKWLAAVTNEGSIEDEQHPRVLDLLSAAERS